MLSGWNSSRGQTRKAASQKAPSSASFPIVAAGMVVVFLGCTSTKDRPREVPRLEFARDPYMGVACPVPNSTACDRVGLALWFDERPVEVTATINGRHFALSDRWGEHVRGFLQPAGLHSPPFDLPEMWFGDPAVEVPVRIEARDTHGRTTSFSLRVGLHAGWG